jgi:hypothetical protein
VKKQFLIGGAAALALSVGVATLSHATINPNVELVNNSVGVAVSPFYSERLVLRPGDVEKGRFRVRQTGRDTNEIYVHVKPLGTQDGSFNNAPDYERMTERTNITKWLTVDSVDGCSISRVEDNKTYFWMRPQEECYVNYTIRVPHNAVGGSQDAALFVQSVAIGTISGAGIQSSFAFAYKLFSNIDAPGAIAQGRVVENHIPWLLFNPPLGVTSKVENTGNVDFITDYTVEMHNWFGGQEVYTKSWDMLAYADSELNSGTEWAGAPTLGLFEVRQKISMLDQKVEHETLSERTQLVLIVPIWLIVLIALIIIMLASAIYLRHRQNQKRRA